MSAHLLGTLRSRGDLLSPHHSIPSILRRIARGAPMLALLAVLLAACSGEDPASPSTDSGRITTGEMTLVSEQTLAPGGTLRVTSAGSAIDGLTIDMPAGAYPSGMAVRISSAPITAHQFGANFSPVTPLIRIENGGAFAARPMRLRIPLPELQGRFPVAFYYDREEGTLEAIAPVGRSATWLDVAVRHFSEIVVSAVQIDLLRQGGGFSTLFDPQDNGWPFVNNGAWPEPDGMCAGMSLGAAHYFSGFGSSILLRTFFDNEPLWFRTPKVTADDVTGIRFCAELQRAFGSANAFWTSTGSTPFDGFLAKSEEDHFWSLCYAMLVTTQPQFLYLAVRGDASAPAHAIIAFDYTIDAAEGRLSVYDPNYPGSTGTISFDFATGRFRPYTSAANALALEQGNTFAYDQIVFIPMTTICDPKEIDRIWAATATHSLGDARYPSYELWAVPVDNQQLPRVKLLDVRSGKTTFVPYRDFTVELVPKDPAIPFALTAWIDLPSLGEIEKQDPAAIITLERPSKENLVGVEVRAKAAGRNHFSWTGFHWFRIRLQSMWIEPADTTVGVNQELRLVARHNGTAPANARFEWEFGDGKTESRTGDSTITHVYEQQGTYTVTVRMFVPGESTAAGSAQSTVNATLWRSVMVTLSGMDTAPPSTIKTRDGQDIPSMVWANRVGGAPPLTWTGQEFTVDFAYRMSGLDVNTRVSGRISDDGKTITTLTAVTSATGSSDYRFSTAIAMTGFPIEGLGPSAPMGGMLTGPAAQARVSNVSWRQSSTDGQGNTVVSELGSIDWSSTKTTLSVYFYR